ncbi:hypothetical protein FRAHR75_170086 [Frankia sp. Hr75.2]|nr:hypothetical protein FRAHR75_170086 [Frankia sp. Hr75.2]
MGRLATYLLGSGDILVRVNGWDPAVLARFRADKLVQGFRDARVHPLDHESGGAWRIPAFMIRPRCGPCRGRSKIDEFNGHGRDATRVQGLSLANSALDGQRIAATPAVGKDRGRPRAAADRDPHPQRPEATALSASPVANLFGCLGGQADERPAVSAPGLPNPQLTLENDDHELSVAHGADSSWGGTSRFGRSPQPGPHWARIDRHSRQCRSCYPDASTRHGPPTVGSGQG